MGSRPAPGTIVHLNPNASRNWAHEPVKREQITTERKEIGEEVVRARTGRSSQAWYSILDRWGAKGKDRILAARYLEEEYGLTRWWAQTIVIRYEWARRLRD